MCVCVCVCASVETPAPEEVTAALQADRTGTLGSWQSVWLWDLIVLHQHIKYPKIYTHILLNTHSYTHTHYSKQTTPHTWVTVIQGRAYKSTHTHTRLNVTQRTAHTSSHTNTQTDTYTRLPGPPSTKGGKLSARGSCLLSGDLIKCDRPVPLTGPAKLGSEQGKGTRWDAMK